MNEGGGRPGGYSFRIGTAGSCTLVLQTVLPALMLADGQSTVAVCGGTHNPLAPPFHFLERSFAPLLRRAGVGIELQLVRLGFYPAGGGEPTWRFVSCGPTARRAARWGRTWPTSGCCRSRWPSRGRASPARSPAPS